jgi:hypothetical protein
VLGHSRGETSRVEVVKQLVAKFQRMEELCLRLEGPGMWICALLNGPPAGQARWADHLDEATGRLEAEMAKHHQVVTELEALWTSAAFVGDLVLGDVDRPSSLAPPMESAGRPDLRWLLSCRISQS